MPTKLDKTKLTKGLLKKEKLAPYLDKALRSFDEPFTFEYTPKGSDDAWHPSGDCTPSILELYEKANAHLDAAELLAEPDANVEVVPANISPSLRKSFIVGHYWHQLIQHLIVEKLGFATPEAIERRGSHVWTPLHYVNLYHGVIPPDSRVTLLPAGQPFGWATGSGDVAPLVLPKGWEGIMDIKSMSARTFNLSTVPFADKYECQINIYMDFFDMERGLILGVCKDTPHEFKEFEFIRNQPLIDVIYEKWEIVSDFLALGEPPKDIKIELPLSGPVIA